MLGVRDRVMSGMECVLDIGEPYVMSGDRLIRDGTGESIINDQRPS